MKAAIVHNPRAGKINAVRLLPAVREALQGLGWAVELRSAVTPDDIGSLVRAAMDEGVETVFVSGGDGTVGAAAHVLCGSDVTLGVLPTGTSNVWAQELGLPRSAFGPRGALVQAAMLQAHGDIMPMDLGSCGGRCFMLWAGLGLDAHIVQAVGPRIGLSKHFGRLDYILKGMWAARHWKGHPMVVHCESETISGDMVSVIASNIRLFAGGLVTLDPGARADDGELALWCFEGWTFSDSMGHFIRMLQGRHADHPQVRRVSGRRFVIQGTESIPSQVDGEVAGKSMCFEIEVLPGALKVFVPKLDVLHFFADRMDGNSSLKL